MKNIIRALIRRLKPNTKNKGTKADPMDPNWYKVKQTHFEQLTPQPRSIIFLGDSLTEAGQWREMLLDERILNRGIGGDTVAGVSARIHSVLSSCPAKIYLLIGTNDILHGVPAESIFEQFANLINEIKGKSEIVLTTVPPINIDGRPEALKEISSFNRQLRSFAKAEMMPIIDLHEAFADDIGKLRPDYSVDGVHVNGSAYAHWVSLIRPTLPA